MVSIHLNQIGFINRGELGLIYSVKIFSVLIGAPALDTRIFSFFPSNWEHNSSHWRTTLLISKANINVVKLSAWLMKIWKDIKYFLLLIWCKKAWPLGFLCWFGVYGKKRFSYHQLCFPISQDVDVRFKIWLQIMKEQNLFVHSIRMTHCNIAMNKRSIKVWWSRSFFIMVARRSRAGRVEKKFLSHRRIHMEDIK